ncbi:hypothetical protein DY000_02060117 [Brassica cretica]|uniref:Uncharacterized protein n=1 Tax=Brassica cretica TaxID=69181 RepID=A0ABQ7AP76_BRACR|nr:hypothetical protein DY000_02060117 [Brassica cretica]
MQFDTQKHEVSQYMRSAHANRHAEARVSRCMNTRHAEGKVDVEVSSFMARENSKGHVYAHVSPRMQPEAGGMTHKRLGGPKFGREVPKYYPEARGGYVRLLISPFQSNQDIDTGFWLKLSDQPAAHRPRTLGSLAIEADFLVVMLILRVLCHIGCTTSIGVYCRRLLCIVLFWVGVLSLRSFLGIVCRVLCQQQVRNPPMLGMSWGGLVFPRPRIQWVQGNPLFAGSGRLRETGSWPMAE